MKAYPSINKSFFSFNGTHLLIWLLALLFLSSSLPAQLAPNPELQIPCGRYRTGKMEYIDKNFGGIRLKRTRRKEIQYNENTDNKIVFKIDWISDCEYKLIFKRSKKPTRYKKGWEINVNMVRIEEEFYDFDYELHGIVFYGTARKELTNKEIKQKRKQELLKLKKMEQDSIEAVQKQDSIAKAKEEGLQAPPETTPEEEPEDGKSNKKKDKNKDKGDKKKDKKKDKDKKDKGDKKKGKKKKEKNKDGKKKDKEKKAKKPKDKPDKKDKKSKEANEDAGDDEG